MIKARLTGGNVALYVFYLMSWMAKMFVVFVVE